MLPIFCSKICTYVGDKAFHVFWKIILRYKISHDILPGINLIGSWELQSLSFGISPAGAPKYAWSNFENRRLIPNIKISTFYVLTLALSATSEGRKFVLLGGFIAVKFCVYNELKILKTKIFKFHIWAWNYPLIFRVFTKFVIRKNIPSWRFKLPPRKNIQVRDESYRFRMRYAQLVRPLYGLLIFTVWPTQGSAPGRASPVANFGIRAGLRT